MTTPKQTRVEREAELFLRKLAVLDELKKQLQVDVPSVRNRLEADLARVTCNRDQDREQDTTSFVSD